jgi:branched-chain amino acid transport system substrate-binding protein
LLSALYAYYWEKEFAPKGLKRIAILSATDEASKSSTERGEQGLRRVGADIVYKTEFPPGQKTFSRVLSDAFATEPAAVFLGTSVSQGSIVTKEWWDSGLSKDIVWMVPEEWVIQSALEAVTPSPGALDNKMFSPSGGGGEALRAYTARAYDIMMTRFKEVYGQDAELEHEYGVNMWDGIMVGALAIQAAGNPTPKAVSQSIIEVSSPPGVKVYSFSEGKRALEEGKDIDYEGAASDCNFDEWGNPYPPNGIYMVRDGKWQQIELISPDDQKAFVARID